MTAVNIFGFVLTYMATNASVAITSLERVGVLHLFELPPWEERRPLWPLYLASGFLDWVEATPRLDTLIFV